jgi:neopullulanase
MLSQREDYPDAAYGSLMNLLDSHDTPRFLSIVGGDVTSLRLALTILMTLPGAPTIYYGDEIGLTGELDPYSRGAFPWDEPESWDRDLLAFVTEAIALRHRHPVLRRGRFEAVGSAGRAVGYVRTLDDAAALIVVNAGDEPERLSIAVPDAAGRSFREVLATVPGAGPGALALAGDGRAEVVLSTRSGAVLLAG